jgi:hypothetical protein
MNFFTFAFERDYFEGLRIDNPSLFVQMFQKEFKNYYGEDMIRNVRWERDLTTILN